MTHLILDCGPINSILLGSGTFKEVEEGSLAGLLLQLQRQYIKNVIECSRGIEQL